MEEPLVRQMISEDIDSAMRLKDAESWNQTESDWGYFLESNPELCLVASLNNEVVGTVTAINYHNRKAWIGMMLVSSDHRRKGVGLKLLRSIIDRLAGCDLIGLDATPVGALVYQGLGFREEHELVRMSAQGIESGSIGPYGGSGIEPIEASDILEICRLDEEAFGANRSGLIQHLVENGPDLCWRAKRKGKITGFNLGRKGTRFTHIGPVVANSLRDAKALVAQISRNLEGSPAVLDVPADKNKWQSWLTRLGFSKQRLLTRMHLHRNRSGIQSETQYAICGPEFG